MEEKVMEDTGGGWSPLSQAEDHLGSQHHQNPGESTGQILPQDPQKEPAHRHLDFGHLASRM